MPATVIPVTGLNLGPVGSVSQSDFPLRTPRQVNPADIYSLHFGEPAVLNSNNTYSSVKQTVLGGDLVVSQTGTIGSGTLTTITVVSATGIAVGQSVSGPGITAGTLVTVVSGTTITIGTAASGAETAQLFSFYAAGVAIVHGTALGIAAANTNTNFSFPMAGTLGAMTEGGKFSPGQIADVLTQGTMNVACNVGTPTAGGLVYIRVALNVAIPAGVVGGFEAAADGGNTVVIDCMKWKTGVLSSDGTAQVTIPTRVLV